MTDNNTTSFSFNSGSNKKADQKTKFIINQEMFLNILSKIEGANENSKIKLETEKIIEIVKAGEVFAEALMFTNQIGYPVSSAALAETIVISINANNFQEMLKGSTATCLLMLGSMSFQLRKLIKEIDTITLHSGTCRVASYLIEEMFEDRDNFTLDTAKNVIAARLSVKPETFSRIIKNLKNQGILTIEGNCVTVHDIDALKELSII